MIQAGQVLSPQSAADKWLYNCIRNIACQREFYMPINTFDYLMLFIDGFNEVPELVEFTIVDCNGIETPMPYLNYVISKQPNGRRYGVFTDWDIDISTIAARFYIKAVITIAGIEYVYYTNFFENNACNTLTFVTSCYNDTSYGSDALDCNGLYYGLPDQLIYLGNPDLRYYHNAYLRDAEVLELANRMELIFFNSLIAYRNNVTKNYELRFELIPTFYKDILLAVFNRGNIEINEVPYQLEASQDFAMSNEGARLWRMDIKLVYDCKQYFSCNATICVPAPMPDEPDPDEDCLANYETAEVTQDEGFNIITFSDGFLEAGDHIEWILSLLTDPDTPIETGTTTTNTDNITESIDPDTTCYILKWRKYCAATDNYTEYNTYNFGSHCSGEDCLECGSTFNYSYEPNSYNVYPEQCINLDPGTYNLVWESFDRPNRFSIYRDSHTALVATTGWVGVADYIGPWGSSLATAENGSLPFIIEAGHSYTVVVECGGADPDNLLSDSANITISC